MFIDWDILEVTKHIRNIDNLVCIRTTNQIYCFQNVSTISYLNAWMRPFNICHTTPRQWRSALVQFPLLFDIHANTLFGILDYLSKNLFNSCHGRNLWSSSVIIFYSSLSNLKSYTNGYTCLWQHQKEKQEYRGTVHEKNNKFTSPEAVYDISDGSRVSIVAIE